MKACISTYSFHALTSKGEIKEIDIPKLAHELGFKAIEVCDIPEDKLDAPETYAEELKAECEKYGITIANFVFSSDFLNGRKESDMNPDCELARIRGRIDYAALLGCKTVRHDALWSLGECPSFDKALEIIAPRIREISEYARTKGIKTMVENHGFICQAPDRMERLYNAVDCDNFGLLCDIGNFLCSDSEPARSVSIVAPYTAYVHAKDFYFKSGNSADVPAEGQGCLKTSGGNFIKGAPIGHGCVPVTQCLRILKGAGYDGYVTIEYEGAEDCMKGIKISKENLERAFSNIG